MSWLSNSTSSAGDLHLRFQRANGQLENTLGTGRYDATSPVSTVLGSDTAGV